MKRIVISQPMFFPWVGIFEQIRLADVYVHYDDVQFSKGFFNRVQIKLPEGTHWLTLPLKNLHRRQTINQVVIDNGQDWKHKHLRMLAHSYAKAPYVREMLRLVESVYANDTDTLAQVATASMEAICGYFDLAGDKKFHTSSALGIGGQGSERILALSQHFGANIYVTGHGARNYLDHELFERSGVRVEYMDYLKSPYPQLHGPFTPYVSALDLIANAGREGRQVIASGTKYWKDALK